MDRNIVCLGPGHRRAPGLAVAALGELSPALLLALCVLNSLGDSPSLSVLKILTALLGDIMIFLTRDILISCLLLLATLTNHTRVSMAVRAQTATPEPAHGAMLPRILPGNSKVMEHFASWSHS